MDQTLMNRRRALTLLGGFGVATVAAACNATNPTTTSPTTGGGGSSTTTSAVIPEETAGPYPGDGSNGPDILTQDGVVRSDIRPSFGQYSGTAQGVLLTVKLTVIKVSENKPVSGAAVYAWHADRDGLYSLYTKSDQNYLRGVQETASDGSVTFTTIYPGCYSGRWPHIHFEVYESLKAATSGGTKLKTSQLALPEDVCKVVYATSGYEQSVTNLSQTSLAKDMVFGDGWSAELSAVTGDATNGYTATLPIGI